MKTEQGVEFPAAAYAYIGDPEKVDTWKIRLWESPEKKETARQLGDAAAAMSSGGFRGNPADIPAADRAAVIGKIRAGYRKLGVENAAMPDHIQLSDAPRFVVELTDVAPGDGLKRIALAKLGRWIKGKTKFAITAQTMSDLVANFRKRPADTVIDYEHASEFPDVAGGGPVPAAGWLKEIEDGPDPNGILWGRAEFTSRAQQMIGEKEYRYLSPVIDWSKRDKTSGEPQGATLTSMALTNRPFLESLPALALSDRGWEIDRGDAGDGAVRKEQRVTKVILADRVARTVRLVADDGTESTVAVEGLEAPPLVIRLSDIRRGAEGLYDFAPLNATEGDVLIAGEVVRAMQAQAELDAVVGKGLITPAQRPFYEKMALSDLAGFRELAKTMKPAIDLTERGIGGVDAANLDEYGKVEKALLDKVNEKLKANPALQYHEGLKLVASENPDLNRRYTELTRKKMGGDK